MILLTEPFVVLFILFAVICLMIEKKVIYCIENLVVVHSQNIKIYILHIIGFLRCLSACQK